MLTPYQYYQIDARTSHFIHPKVRPLWAEIVAQRRADGFATGVSAQGDDKWLLEGEVGYEINVRLVRAALNSVGESGNITFDINSPGGSLNAGAAIYNTLIQHKGHITVNVIGIAASAAQFITMGGHTIFMGRAATQFVHNAWALVVGNTHDLADAAVKLAKFDSGIRDILMYRTRRDAATVQEWMDNDTLFTAEEAVDNGLADGYLKDESRPSGAPAQSGNASALELQQATDYLNEAKQWRDLLTSTAK